MKKRFVILLTAAALMASLAISAAAAPGTSPTDGFVGSPSGGQRVETDDELVEVVTDNVVTGGFIRQKGTPETRPLEQIDYPVIKVTTLSMSQTANAALDTSYPGATDAQKAGMMTESGLSYADNDKVNQTAEHYYAADTTSEFVAGYELSFFDNLVSLAQGRLKAYSVVQMMDISANSLAINTGRSVRLTFSAPGVREDSRVMVARIRDGAMEFVSATAGNGSISFSVYPYDRGTYVLLTRVD